MPSKPFSAPWPVVLLGGFLIPGASHFLFGERRRGVIIGVTVVLLFLAGVLMGGVRVVEFPSSSGPSLLSRILSQPAFIGQFFAGPLALAFGFWSHQVASNPATADIMSHSRLYDICVLYTGFAGALNLLAIIDATARSLGGVEPRDQSPADTAPPAPGAA
jgi:hypothetical protein